jgi:hypothetical protein
MFYSQFRHHHPNGYLTFARKKSQHRDFFMFFTKLNEKKTKKNGFFMAQQKPKTFPLKEICFFTVPESEV